MYLRHETPSNLVLRRNDLPTPATPTPELALNFAFEQVTRVSLLDILINITTDFDHFNPLLLQSSANSLNLMSRVPQILPEASGARATARGARTAAVGAAENTEVVWRTVGGVAGTFDFARVLGIAVRLLLDLVCRQTILTTRARHRPVALADTSANVCVADAPAPDAFIRRIILAEAVPAVLAEPHPVGRACTGDGFTARH